MTYICKYFRYLFNAHHNILILCKTKIYEYQNIYSINISNIINIEIFHYKYLRHFFNKHRNIYLLMTKNIS